MQSSYNLIRNNNAVINGDKNIVTKVPITEKLKVEQQIEQQQKYNEDEILRSYEIIGSSIINKAKFDGQRILITAADNARITEKEAYEIGYEQGKQNGYEDGYNEGYPKAINKGKEEVSGIINTANTILAKANDEYKAYMESKKEQIINLAFEMAKFMAGMEFQKENSILSILEPMIEDCKGEENLVIKCNGNYIDSIKERVSFWKSAYTIKGEIFIIEDPLMELGNAIIEKNTGKIVVGMDIALQKLEEAIKEQYLGGHYD